MLWVLRAYESYYGYYGPSGSYVELKEKVAVNWRFPTVFPCLVSSCIGGFGCI